MRVRKPVHPAGRPTKGFKSSYGGGVADTREAMAALMMCPGRLAYQLDFAMFEEYCRERWGGFRNSRGGICNRGRKVRALGEMAVRVMWNGSVL